ncbi:MAG TPA: hypothetical protein VLD37_03345 [Candidatus Bilamarchaeum sp.]|nr:hypothetical protein [Candidatus Bilamarchaeum sp.]
MVKTRALPSAQSDIQTMRHFYKSIGAMQQYKHCHEVLRTGAGSGIVDESVIRNPRESLERRKANLVLRRHHLIHSTDLEQVLAYKGDLPPALRDPDVLEIHRDFERLTLLERTGASTDSFSNVLNNGRRSLAILTKIADYSVTHDTENQLEGFIYDGKPSLIRRYASMEDAYESMRMDAKAGEKLYAPIAELFGYPQLAGNIFLHSFRVNHPEIYNFVLSSMREPTMHERMEWTQEIVREFSKTLGMILKSYGFEAEVTLRMEKHDGKKMNKILRLLRDDFRKTEEGSGLMRLMEQAKERGDTIQFNALSDAFNAACERYVRVKVTSFDFHRFNDWVAVRAVINRFRGTPIDELVGACPPGEQNGGADGVDITDAAKLANGFDFGPMRIAVRSIANAIQSLGDLFGNSLGRYSSKVVYYNKPNGYRAIHFDTFPDTKDGNQPLPFEVQLKTREWSDVAEHGKAAHYYYIGGDSGFVDMIAKAYHDIIRPSEPRSRPFNPVPPSRRSSQVVASGSDDGSEPAAVTPRRTR